MFLNRRISKQQEHIELIKATMQSHGYIYKSPVGQGGFASVMLVESERYKCDFVVKVSEKSAIESADGKGEVNDAEVSNLIKLSHPYIISMYEYFYDHEFLYIVLEYCPGGSLADILKKTGPIRGNALYTVCYQILTALKHCHDQGIAHRDLKPANILIDKNNRCKLADFGLSNRNDTGLSYEFGGTKPYMAPEIFLRTAHDPFKADIWALGVTFYQIATGRLPWECDNSKEMQLAVTMGIISFAGFKLSAEFIHVLRSMIEVTPMKRSPIEDILEASIFQNLDHRPQLGLMNKSSSIGSQLSLASIKTSNSSRLLLLNNNNNNANNVHNNVNSYIKPDQVIEEDDDDDYDDRNEEKQMISLAKCGSVLSFQNVFQKKMPAIRRCPSKMNGLRLISAQPTFI